MSLEHAKQPAVQHGWLRALMLLIIYVSLSVGAGYVVNSIVVWIAVTFLIAILLVYLFLRFIDRRPLQNMGIDYSNLYPHSLTGFFLATLLVSIGSLLIYAFKSVVWIDIAPVTDQLFLDAVLLMLVAAGEELVFRGYVFTNLAESMNKWAALIVSSLLFTIVHVSNPSVPVVALVNTFLGGLVLGMSFMYSQSLWTPFFFHFAWNFLQGPVLGFPVSGLPFSSILIPEISGHILVSGGEYGMEGSVVATILLLFCLLSGVALRRVLMRPPG
jgi:membrane protease YdiL (CAAX protease family)